MPTIIVDPDAMPETARKLLDAAGGDASKIRTITDGPSLAFDVDDDVAEALAKPARTTRKKPPAQDDGTD